jgi:hypothetical protein
MKSGITSKWKVSFKTVFVMIKDREEWSNEYHGDNGTIQLKTNPRQTILQMITVFKRIMFFIFNFNQNFAGLFVIKSTLFHHHK